MGTPMRRVIKIQILIMKLIDYEFDVFRVIDKIHHHHEKKLWKNIINQKKILKKIPSKRLSVSINFKYKCQRKPSPMSDL